MRRRLSRPTAAAAAPRAEGAGAILPHSANVARYLHFMSTTTNTRFPKYDEVVWGIDLSADCKFPTVAGEYYGVQVASEPLVSGIDAKITGAIVYTDEATARAAHAKHPPASVGGQGVVQQLRYRPAYYTRFVRV